MSVTRKEQSSEAVAQRLYAASKPRNLTPPPTFTNAAMKAAYVPPSWPVRAGADSHFNHASLGMGAQIVRTT